MTDDHYIYDESSYSMTGERTRKTYKLGQPVKIRVESAEPHQLFAHKYCSLLWPVAEYFWNALHETYKLGQPVKIRVESADKLSRTIDFSMLH